MKIDKKRPFETAYHTGRARAMAGSIIPVRIFRPGAAAKRERHRRSRPFFLVQISISPSNTISAGPVM